ncbi:unnamed protein product [Angiostrongylus costaricensis]|uniref:RRM domain-containing protein n=1 Tax=Angiostrongylus costaricensis TaxID=334426 RepID=A0A158PLV7_ANGCS|nr:unnamed protein product [Angiostrongylus costaricensis]
MDDHHHTATGGGGSGSASTATMNNSTTSSGVADGGNVGGGGNTAGDPNKHDEARVNNADSDDGSQAQDPGKMFIGGLSWQTTAEGLRDYFGRFGEVNECMVMRDPATKRARGFGFITFVDPASVDRVLATEEHELDGKKVFIDYFPKLFLFFLHKGGAFIDPKVAFPKRSQTKVNSLVCVQVLLLFLQMVYFCDHLG